MQENAGEDAETACSCREQAQTGEPDDGVVACTAVCHMFINTLLRSASKILVSMTQTSCVLLLSLYISTDVLLFSL